MSDTVTYILDENEVFCALWHTRRSNTRLIAQTVLLLVLGLPSLIALCCGKADAVTVLCGTVLPLLAVVQWVWPLVEFRREARAIATQKTPITLSFTEESIAVENHTIAWQNAAFRRVKTCVLWQVDRQWIVIPRRAVSDDWWQKIEEEAAR